MSDVVVVPVQSRRERREFFDFPWSHYAGDPFWVPPLRQNQLELLNYKRHPFYDENEIQTFVARRGSVTCGRIAAIVNRGHIRKHQEQRGFFGFFESIDDQSVADALFRAASEWLAGRGITSLRGPTNPSQNYECGLLVEGFDSSPRFMMTYNKPFYDRLITGAGFQKGHDLYAFWGHSEMLKSLDRKLRYMVDAATERFNIKVRKLDTKRFRQDVEMFLDIYNQSMDGTWGFVPMSPGEIRHTAAGLKHLIEPRLALVAEIDGKPIGATFALLDYNPRIKAIDGRLFPFGFLRLLHNKRAIKNIRVIAANVVPEYQAWGVGLVVLDGLVPLVREWDIEEVEFSWVMESNKLSRGSLERGGAILKKIYRLYDREL